ncbi:MAG: BfmA/BtgA family mobilization protein [Candidatus Thermoplasmatota archaeon]
MATTIQIEKETREKLKRFGHKGESYDEIIERLMNYCEELNMEEFIEARWKRLQEEKDEYISLDEI